MRARKTSRPQYLQELNRFSYPYYGLVFKGNYNEDWQLLYAGAVEKPDLFFLRDTLSKLAPENGVFVDVGASKGGHTLFMSKFAKTVIAYEPYPPIFEELSKMVSINNLENVIVRDVGLGESPGSVPFFIPKDSILTGSFLRSFNKQGEAYGELRLVTGDADLEELRVDRID